MRAFHLLSAWWRCRSAMGTKRICFGSNSTCLKWANMSYKSTNWVRAGRNPVPSNSSVSSRTCDNRGWWFEQMQRNTQPPRTDIGLVDTVSFLRFLQQELYCVGMRLGTHLLTSNKIREIYVTVL